MKKQKLPFFLCLFSFVCITGNNLIAQCLTLGADLSYVNSVQAKGGTFRNEAGQVVDPYLYFAQRGAGMTRIRLWHTPENVTDHCGQPISTNNLQDVTEAFQRAKAAGMLLNLAIHYGDYFNDPATQKMPVEWEGLPHAALLDSISKYTYRVLETLYEKNVLPDVVAIGNETTWGFVDATDQTNGWEWPQDAEKFNAGLGAVDAFNAAHFTQIKKAIHFTDKTAEWLSGLFQEKGVTNFDIIGLSFYPVWSDFTTVEAFGQLVAKLRTAHNKEIMVFETGAVWSGTGADNYNNIFNSYGNLDYPISPQGQKNFLTDLAKTVWENGGTALLYWEPAWISSALCDKWGQGSSYENAGFFDFNNNNRPLPAFDFFDFCNTLNSVLSVKNRGIRVFPNPGNGDELIVESPVPLTFWHLLTTDGKLVAEGAFPQENAPFRIQLNHPQAGIYVLKIQNEAGLVSSERVKIGN